MLTGRSSSVILPRCYRIVVRNMVETSETSTVINGSNNRKNWLSYLQPSEYDQETRRICAIMVGSTAMVVTSLYLSDHPAFKCSVDELTFPMCGGSGITTGFVVGLLTYKFYPYVIAAGGCAAVMCCVVPAVHTAYKIFDYNCGPWTIFRKK
jgi:hypothetical protein